MIPTGFELQGTGGGCVAYVNVLTDTSGTAEPDASDWLIGAYRNADWQPDEGGMSCYSDGDLSFADALERAMTWANDPRPLTPYFVEGACDGSLFAETVYAFDMADAERQAVARLSEAWGQDGDTLSDMGDAATVTAYADWHYARDAAPAMLDALRACVDAMTPARNSEEQTAIDMAELAIAAAEGR